MECNRDEAVRAKRIAEEKMMKNDYEGARKIALKAKQLFPELENISQLITVCDIHCSAQKKIYGAEKDFYGILQIENTADEGTIRKQYRKLALVLHPDKNKFAGAEAAFKLLGEANMILSDKGKRSVYDFKIREPARVPVTKANQTSQNKSKNVQNNHQKAAPNPSVHMTFWTYCPFCSIRYQYYRDVVNRSLRCQNCSKLFIAHDIGAAKEPHFQAQQKEKVKVNIQKDVKSKVNVQKHVETKTFKDTNKKRVAESNESNSDKLSPNKRSKMNKPLHDEEEMKQKEVKPEVNKESCKQEAPEHADVSMPGVNNTEKPEGVYCPDSEFTNFDQDKEEHCFAVNQIWACYDSVDGMPKFYAKIKKNYKSEFRMKITWLEPEPEKLPEIKWAEEGLPVSCGKFVRGETEETKDRLMFSHQIFYKKSGNGSRISYVIYPQKGEIWALFRDWDINWSLDAENHKKYKFDIVEIISVHDDCVTIAFMVKVKPFASVFESTLEEHKISVNELFRFSHRVKSVKLTGTEKVGVPAGSFELDTASLPDDIEEYYNFKKVNTDTQNTTGQTSKSDQEKVKPKTPKKHANDLDNETPNLRRSSRGLTRDQHSNAVNSGQSHSSQIHKEKVKEATNNTPKKPINSVDNEMLNLRRSPRGLKEVNHL